MPKDEHPLPRIEDIIQQLGDARYFTTIDLASGFHQIPIKVSDQIKTAFSTHEGHFHYTRMLFRLKTAPRVFQRAINAALAGIIGNECFFYLDDIIIHSKTFEEQRVRLKHVFRRLREFGLPINLDKCEFAKSSITYLGHVISKDGSRPMPEKLASIKKLPTSTGLERSSTIFRYMYIL